MPIKACFWCERDRIIQRTQRTEPEEIDNVIIAHAPLRVRRKHTLHASAGGLVRVVLKIFVHRMPNLHLPHNANIVSTMETPCAVILQINSIVIDLRVDNIEPIKILDTTEKDRLQIVVYEGVRNTSAQNLSGRAHPTRRRSLLVQRTDISGDTIPQNLLTLKTKTNPTPLEWQIRLGLNPNILA